MGDNLRSFWLLTHGPLPPTTQCLSRQAKPFAVRTTVLPLWAADITEQDNFPYINGSASRPRGVIRNSSLFASLRTLTNLSTKVMGKYCLIWDPFS